jgi:LysM repeat protein
MLKLIVSILILPLILVPGFLLPTGSVIAQEIPTSTPPNGGTSLVATSTPEPDGAIYHIVKDGENPSTIAQAYGIGYGELLALNGLGSDPMIFPGDRLLIRTSSTATPTPDVTNTPTLTRTLRPTITATPSPTSLPTKTSTPTPLPTPTPTEETFLDKVSPTRDPLLFLIGMLGVSGVVLMGIGTLLKRR